MKKKRIFFLPDATKKSLSLKRGSQRERERDSSGIGDLKKKKKIPSSIFATRDSLTQFLRIV